MPAYSETIIQAIMEALEGITVADGYSQTVQKVQRFDRRSLSTAEKSCIHVMKGEEGKVLVGDGWDVTLSVDLDCYLYQDPDDPLTTDELQAAFQWDVERALTGVDWATLQADLVGEEAISFAIQDPSGAVEDGLIVSLTITYRLAEFNMTTPI